MSTRWRFLRSVGSLSGALEAERVLYTAAMVDDVPWRGYVDAEAGMQICWLLPKLLFEMQRATASARHEPLSMGPLFWGGATGRANGVAEGSRCSTCGVVMAGNGRSGRRGAVRRETCVCRKRASQARRDACQRRCAPDRPRDARRCDACSHGALCEVVDSLHAGRAHALLGRRETGDRMTEPTACNLSRAAAGFCASSASPTPSPAPSPLP